MSRVSDTVVSDWLIWARNFGEVVAYDDGRTFTRRKGPRRFRIRVTPGVTRDGVPFRPKEGLLDLFGHTAEDVVPPEMMLTAREALVFAYGCAVGRSTAFAGLSTKHGWQEERADEWTPEQRAAFAERWQAVHDANREELDRELREREEARQERIRENQRRKRGPLLLNEEVVSGEVVDD